MTDTDICNAALVNIGAQTISSLADGTKGAQLLSVRYALLRDAVFRMHPWSCLTKRVILAPTGISPAFGFQYAFDLPADFIRLVEINDVLVSPDNEQQYAVESNQLLMQESVCNLKYTSRVEDAAKYDALLVETLGWYIASAIAFSMTQNGDMEDKCTKKFGQLLAKARFANSYETPAKRLSADYFLDSRVQRGPNIGSAL